MPDIFSFGHIDLMKLLWGDIDHRYDLDINIPEKYKDDVNKIYFDGATQEDYCAENELYLMADSTLKCNFCK